MASDLKIGLKAEAYRLGFSLCGITSASEADTFSRFEAWLDAGYAGGMQYLHDRREARRHPNAILDGVRTVVMLGLPYHSGSHPDPLPPQHARVARYAQGPDYHHVIWDKLNLLCAWLAETVPGCRSRGVVDTAPLLERDFARRAGLGWIGKNTMLINPHQGSYFFLAALLTDLDLNFDVPFETHHCGTCTACLDACPTQAFPEPGTLDATKCISYLTIEHRGPLPEGTDLHGWLFGCDVCQEVCPWNRFAGDSALPHDASLASIDGRVVLAMSDGEYRQQFRGTPLLRAKHAGLVRNARTVLDHRHSNV